MEDFELTGDYIRGKIAIQKGWPWITPDALLFLDSIMQPEWKVFEWGAGGSTIWFARHCAKLVTVEHSKKWTDWAAQRLKKEGLTNAHLIQVHEQIYARQITKVGGAYDLVFVDGKIRFKCIELAIQHIKQNGWLMIDNSERDILKPALRHLKSQGWKGTHFRCPPHPALAETNKWTTSFYQKEK